MDLVVSQWIEFAVIGAEAKINYVSDSNREIVCGRKRELFELPNAHKFFFTTWLMIINRKKIDAEAEVKN